MLSYTLSAALVELAVAGHPRQHRTASSSSKWQVLMALLLAAGALPLLGLVAGQGNCSHVCRRCSSGLQQLAAAAVKAAAGLAPQQQQQQEQPSAVLQVQDLQGLTVSGFLLQQQQQQPVVWWAWATMETSLLNRRRCWRCCLTAASSWSSLQATAV
jgi:hypothetical protein